MDDIYFKFKNNDKPHKGGLLISEPYLPDPNFKRTVILLCDHNDEGTFGFVLNKSTKAGLKEFIDIDSDFNPEVFVGGPVQQDSLNFLHRGDEFEGGMKITEGLYWGGNFEHLKVLMDQGQLDESNFRFFIGYSGWGIGQLEKEVNENSWIVTKGLTADVLLETNSNLLWKQVLKAMGGKYEMFSNYPTDPRLN